MAHRTATRRRVLAATGAAVSALAVPASASRPTWTTVETPTDRTLHDVRYAGDRAYAVGNGGLVLRRNDDRWRTVLDGGPTGNGNDLYGAAVAGDGDRLWVTGASGAIGEYDTATGDLTDRSAPNDHTGNFNDVAVTGCDDANVFVADDSGAVHYSFDGGRVGTWEDVTPGSGSALHAIDFHGVRAGRVVDGNSRVFETDDGETWTAIGLEDADVSLYGLDATGTDAAHVSGGNGTVHRYDGTDWTVGGHGDADLRDVAVNGRGYAVGGSGVVLERDGEDWGPAETDTGENLRAVTTGPTDVAVGAAGTVLERD